MSGKPIASLIMDAHDELWLSVMKETVLFYVPEKDQKAVLDILMAFRAQEIKATLKLAQKVGNYKKFTKAIEELKNINSITTTEMLSFIARMELQEKEEA